MSEGGNGRTDRWWDEDPADADDPVVAALALLILGAGLGSLFGVPILAAVDFWVIFAIGYAVVLPLVSLLRGRRGGAGDGDRPGRAAEGRDREGVERERVGGEEDGDENVDAALSRLRERYARGDLSEEQFERKLEVLLETETPENARERLHRERERLRREGDVAESDDRAREGVEGAGRARDDREREFERSP